MSDEVGAGSLGADFAGDPMTRGLARLQIADCRLQKGAAIHLGGRFSILTLGLFRTASHQRSAVSLTGRGTKARVPQIDQAA